MDSEEQGWLLLLLLLLLVVVVVVVAVVVVLVIGDWWVVSGGGEWWLVIVDWWLVLLLLFLFFLVNAPLHVFVTFVFLLCVWVCCCPGIFVLFYSEIAGAGLTLQKGGTLWNTNINLSQRFCPEVKKSPWGFFGWFVFQILAAKIAGEDIVGWIWTIKGRGSRRRDGMKHQQIQQLDLVDSKHFCITSP